MSRSTGAALTLCTISDAFLARCDDLRHKIQAITDGEYASAKADVDRLRQELGQSPLPSLQQTLEEKSQQYVLPRRPLPCVLTSRPLPSRELPRADRMLDI